MRFLIVAGGVKPSRDLIEHYGPYDKIYAADHGLDVLLEEQFIPDLVLGDMDSMSLNNRKRLKDIGLKLWILPKEKDETDTYAACGLAMDEGATEIVLLGATGTRKDHELANLFLIEYGEKRGVDILIADENNEITGAVEGDIKSLSSQKFPYVGIIAYTDEAEVTIRHMKYEVRHCVIQRSFQIGVSNEFLGGPGELTVHKGRVFIVYSKD